MTFSAESILTNTQIYALCYYNDNATYPFQWGFLRSDQTSFSVTFQKSGYVRLFGMLLPSVYATQVNSAGTPFNVIDIGVGDGTGTDFDGVMGARITLSFTPPANSNVVPYRGTPANIFMVTDYLHQQGYLLDIHDSAFGNNANQYQTIAIQVDGDVHNSAMIEQMVWIHLFDNSGNLLGVVDTLNNTIVNNICSINLANGFQMMALIQGSGSGNTFNFSIGDPKNDATVKVEEA
ncbi:MAG: hypothetical protein IPJ74_24525 [Saprospiraceae bacterium]|nr:hypothetical protein [Saprospiraceae bacterium]